MIAAPRYQVLTNAAVNGRGLWSRPGGAYGVAVCVSRAGLRFSALRWL